ncbi:MAG: hypothetical protein GY832_31570 [Chloroflexi bacterium]|nr:hypothetical protein [Chloroflexota bacterium]
MSFSRTVSLPSNYKDMSHKELQTLWQKMSRGGGLEAFGGETMMADTLRKQMKTAFDREKGSSTSTASGGTASAGGSGTPASVAQPFERALSALSDTSGDIEKNYQTGKRRTMSNIAMQSVNAGMANTLNMPAAEMAYEGAVRPGMNIGLAQAKAGVLQNLGQTAANVYGTQVGADTSRYGIDTSAATSLQTAQMGADMTAQGQALQFASNRANDSLNRYIAQLNASTQIQNTSPVPTLRAPRL